MTTHHQVPARHAARGAGGRASRISRTSRSSRIPAATTEGLAPLLGVREVFVRFWPFTAGLRGLLVVGAVLSLVTVPFEAASIWLFKVLVDDVLTPRDFGAFPPVAGGYVALTLVVAGLSFAAGQVLTRASESFLLAVRTRTLAHLESLSADFFERRKTGDLLSRLGADVGAVETLVGGAPATAVTALLQVVVYAGLLVAVDPLLAAVAAAVSPLLWFVSRFFAGRLRAVARQTRRSVGELSAIAEEGLSNITLIQAYNAQEPLVDRFRAEGGVVVRMSLAASRLRGVYGPLTELVELLGLLLVVGVGTWRLTRGALTLGELLVFMAYFSQLYGPLRELGQLVPAAFAASAGAERIAEILDARPVVLDDPRPWPVGRATGEVELRDVTFTYPGATRPTLRGVCLRAAPGQLVAVVGSSGSGKSTLTRLMLRFYDPDEGVVLLDGHDVRDRSLADLRDQFALVMQETQMTEGTLRDNVLWARPDAGAQAFEAAVRAADVDTVAASLEDGLDTEVGPRGQRLSGGQRQRVALARAMIRDAPVLLLDEPTAGLDADAERRVLGPIARLRSGRTTLLVTHDLPSTRDADLVVVLDAGTVVEQGRFEDLAARGGVFARLLAARPGSPDQASNECSAAGNDPARTSSA